MFAKVVCRNKVAPVHVVDGIQFGLKHLAEQSTHLLQTLLINLCCRHLRAQHDSCLEVLLLVCHLVSKLLVSLTADKMVFSTAGIYGLSRRLFKCWIRGSRNYDLQSGSLSFFLLPCRKKLFFLQYIFSSNAF